MMRLALLTCCALAALAAWVALLPDDISRAAVVAQRATMTDTAVPTDGPSPTPGPDLPPYPDGYPFATPAPPPDPYPAPALARRAAQPPRAWLPLVR